MIPSADRMSLICALLYKTLISIGNRKLFDQVHFSGYRVWRSLFLTLESVPYQYLELIRKILLEEALVSLFENIGRFYTKDALSVWTNLGKYFVVRLGYASLV